MAEEQDHFLLAEDGGHAVGHLGAQQAGGVEGCFQGDVVEEFGGGNELVETGGAVQAVVSEIDLILAQILQVQVFRTDLEELGQAGDVVQVSPLRLGREMAQLHIFGHAFT